MKNIKDLTNIKLLDELKHRLQCCLNGSEGGGWGNQKFLQNFLDKKVRPRLDDLGSFVDALAALRDNPNDICENKIAIALGEEYNELEAWETSATNYLVIENTRVEQLGRLRDLVTTLGTRETPCQST